MKPSQIDTDELNRILDMHKKLSMDLFESSIQTYDDLVKQREQEVQRQKAIVKDVQSYDK